MRQLFSVFLFSFASLFFSQCEIGEISFALEDVLTFFINGKVEGKDKNERKGDKDEDVINVNLNVDLKAEKKFITTPNHNRNLSDMGDKSFYSCISTTVSQALQNNDGHNVGKKRVFDFAKNSSSPKRDLIHSFNCTQAEEEDSYDEREIIQKPDTYFVGKERVGRDKKELLIHNNKGQQKRKKKKYFDLINNKIKGIECTLKYKGQYGSSIFVQRHAPIVNNKIFQEVGDKKDVHKYLHISQKKNSGQLVRKDKRNNAEKLRKSPTHKNNIKIENFYCKENINNNGKKKEG